MRYRIKTARAIALTQSPGFTLIELLVAVALIAVVVPVIVQSLRVASLAGEVSQRKALAVRIGERVLNEAIINGQMQAAQNGTEKAGPYQFRWKLTDEAWSQLSGMASLNYANSVNQTVVNSTILHQLSVDVTYVAQNRDYSVHLSTLVNVSQQ